MARLTKTQRKNLVKSIRSKAVKLYTSDFPVIMSMKDFDTINKICDRIMKKID
mgnify:CR=1 FL=1